MIYGRFLDSQARDIGAILLNFQLESGPGGFTAVHYIRPSKGPDHGPSSSTRLFVVWDTGASVWVKVSWKTLKKSTARLEFSLKNKR